MQLSSDQLKAAKKILKWFLVDKNTQYITLGGYAGTGKTTLISVIKNKLKGVNKKLKIAFCSYTGRATQNLKNKLKEQGALSYKDTISTIHGLIYDPIENAQGIIIGWERKEKVEADLIIVDEASMIDERIWHDLLSFGIPVLAVGDHGQLPPIKGAFNLMEKPHITLEEIHRQAKNNPIITVSIHARTEGHVPAKKYGKNIVKYSTEDFDFTEASNDLLENYSEDTLILCGYNSTRNKINQYIRNSLGFELADPQVGDRVICLRNNNKKGVYNGMLGVIKSLEKSEKDWYLAEIDMDETHKPYKGLIYGPQFGAPQAINFTEERVLANKGDLFDFGYALTVHKAQGSQAKKVVVFEERFKKTDDEQWKKWLYTAITRAEEELYLFGN